MWVGGRRGRGRPFHTHLAAAPSATVGEEPVEGEGGYCKVSDAIPKTDPGQPTGVGPAAAPKGGVQIADADCDIATVAALDSPIAG